MAGTQELGGMPGKMRKAQPERAAEAAAQTVSWGIKVIKVEIKHVDLNQPAVHARPRQTGVERRATVIHPIAARPSQGVCG